jgi:hypothetical protein
MYITRLNMIIAYYMFVEWLKDFWKPFADISEAQLMAPGFRPGYVK